MDPIAVEQSSEKLAQLYERHSPRAFRLAYLLTGDPDAAEDLVQDAFVKLIGRFADLRRSESFEAYLTRTVVNLSCYSTILSVLPSSEPGIPRAWSPDGSKLLVLREVPNTEPWAAMDLFVLNADGTETRLTDANGFVTGGAFSPDGTEVVYAVTLPWDSSSIYVVDAEGGTPRLLRSAGRSWIPDGGCPGYEGCTDGRRFLRTALYAPTFSPDGTQVAYFDGMGDWGHSLRVMNADGSDPRVLLEFDAGRSIDNLVWSPDGSRLAFATPEVWFVGADGSVLTKLPTGELQGFAAAGPDPYWSPDGSRISYNNDGRGVGRIDERSTGLLATLEIARWDGADVQRFDFGHSGPWNPLDP